MVSASRGSYNVKTSPHIEEKTLEQIIFDPVSKNYTHNVLYRPISAGSWGNGYSNSDVMPYIVGRTDGTQALFGGSAGLYTENDTIYFPNPPEGGAWQIDVNWGYATIFLMDFSDGQLPDTTPPTAPQGVTVQ